MLVLGYPKEDVYLLVSQEKFMWMNTHARKTIIRLNTKQRAVSSPHVFCSIIRISAANSKRAVRWRSPFKHRFIASLLSCDTKSIKFKFQVGKLGENQTIRSSLHFLRLATPCCWRKILIERIINFEFFTANKMKFNYFLSEVV